MNLDQLNPALYAKLLEEKHLKLKDLFADFHPPELEIFASSSLHYRMRAEFRVWHEGEDLYYYMFDKSAYRSVFASE